MIGLALAAWAAEPVVDAFPAFAQPSAAPYRAQVDATWGGMLTFAGRGSLTAGRVGARVGAVHVDVIGGREWSRVHCFLGGCPVEITASWQAVARVGVAGGGDRLRVMPWLGSGTRTSAGLSLWWQSRDGRFEVDFGAGVAVRTDLLLGTADVTWSTVDRKPPIFVVDVPASMPELGVTWHVDRAGVHHLRFGTWAAVPVVGYRVAGRPIAFEIHGGTAVAAWVAAASLSVPLPPR